MIEHEVFDNITADALFLQGRYKEAFERYFRGATELRDERAAFDLAYMYQRGIYVPTNYPLARKFYHAASAMEGGAPLFNLALMEIRGLGAPANLKAAHRHMEEAAAGAPNLLAKRAALAEHPVEVVGSKIRALFERN